MTIRTSRVPSRRHLQHILHHLSTLAFRVKRRVSLSAMEYSGVRPTEYVPVTEFVTYNYGGHS